MKFEDALIKEELNFKTEDKALDKIFRNTLELVYSKNYHIYSGPFGFTVENIKTNDSKYYDMKGNQLISSSNKLNIQYNLILVTQ